MLILVAGERTEPFHVFYGATAKSVRVGVVQNSRGEKHAAIALTYSPQNFLVIETIFKEMKQLRQLPQVHILDEKGKKYVAVSFRLLLQSKLDLIKLLPREELKAIEDRLPFGQVEVIATGESEFESQEVEAFFRRFKRDRFLQVYLNDPEGNPCMLAQVTNIQSLFPRYYPRG